MITWDGHSNLMMWLFHLQYLHIQHNAFICITLITGVKLCSESSSKYSMGV